MHNTFNYCYVIHVKRLLLAEAMSVVGIGVVSITDTTLHLLASYIPGGFHSFYSSYFSFIFL